MEPFKNSTKDRLSHFKKSERECARAIRRHKRALEKLEKVKAKERNAMIARINVLKAEHGSDWK